MSDFETRNDKGQFYFRAADIEAGMYTVEVDRDRPLHEQLGCPEGQVSLAMVELVDVDSGLVYEADANDWYENDDGSFLWVVIRSD